MKDGITSSLYDPYDLGYIRATKVLTKRNNFFLD